MAIQSVKWSLRKASNCRQVQRRNQEILSIVNILYGIDQDERNRLDLHRLYSKTIKDAVITVPAYFNDSQRQSRKDAYYTKILVLLIA